MTRFRLSRRTFLRGVGATISLPILDAMLNDRGLLWSTAHARGEPLPRKLITFFIPNGVPLERWIPPETGPEYTITPCLQPVAALRFHVDQRPERTHRT